ncbi:MAG: hypothetical protein MJ178_10205 [Treponemataceae bacterium]|nr:hypothetical protein [Treponemataceae bacterium]
MKESVKENLSVMCNIATRVSTLILLVNVVLFKVVFKADIAMSMDDILAILLIGLFSGIMNYPLLALRSVGKVVMLILHCLYFIFINAMVLLFGIHQHWFNFHSVASFAVMEGMIIFIYVIVTVLSFSLDYREATAINKMLDSRKNRQE